MSVIFVVIPFLSPLWLANLHRTWPSWCRTRPKLGRIWGGLMSQSMSHTRKDSKGSKKRRWKVWNVFRNVFHALLMKEYWKSSWNIWFFFFIVFVGRNDLNGMIGWRTVFFFYVIFFRRTVKDLKRMIWKVCTPFNLSKRALWPYKQNAFSKNRFLHTLLFALSFIAILLKGLFLKKTFVPWDLLCWVAFFFRRVQVVGLNLTATAIGAMAVQLLQVDGESVGGSGFVRWASWKKGPWLFRGFVGDEILPNQIGDYI